MVAFDLRDQFIEIVACGQSHDFELIGQGFNYIEGLAAYGACRAEDGEGFHEWLASFQSVNLHNSVRRATRDIGKLPR